ncbi:MAG: YbdK family carboxylate-amine ligase [Actinobacteria bacterium]|nr:MAG: YbdK family carboxylate-amine ligase [Actinomycetota bacterium]
MPRTISSTTAGRRTAGTSPSTSGAANATPATIASPEKETLIPLRARSGCTRYKRARRARETRTRPARLRRRTGLPDPGTDCPKSTGRERLIFPGGAAPLPARRGRSSRRGAVRRRRALDRRGRRRPQRVVLRPDRPVSLSSTRLHVRGRLHDRGPPDPRLGAVRRPQPPASRRPGEAGRAQSADCRIRAAFRPERLVLRLGGGRRARPRSPRTLIEQHFDRSLTVGVEEEVWILDAETLELVPRVETLVAGAEGRNLPGVLKTELHATVVELTSDVSDSAEEAVDKLEALRVAAEEIAQQNGLRIAAAGSHPTAMPAEQEIAPQERYRDFVAYAGPTARRQGVSGLHVHIGMPDADTCFRVLETILPWLPLVLALSANSPYFEGRDTGMLSIRAEVLGFLPRRGAPPAVRSYAEWEAFIERMVATGVAGDYTSFWWDVRPHPRFGTLEIRAPDQATSLQRTAALVHLLRDLCAWALDAPARPFDPAERGVYDQNRWAASRFGPHGKLVHPDRDIAVTVPELLQELPVDPRGFDGEGCEADRQLEVGRGGDLRAVCADLVARTRV